MKSSWTQPSLSRDFALLAASALFVLCIISGWLTYSTYTSHKQSIAAELDMESGRIERSIAIQMEDANYMLNSLGKQIVLTHDRNLTKLAEILKSFDKKDYRYSILSWINPNGHMEVSSNHGVLDTPVDISDRDFVKMAAADPWKMVIGQPIEGRVSGRWVIPVAMSLTDSTGKFIGTVALSLDIKILSNQLAQIVRRDGIRATIADKKLVPITQISAEPTSGTMDFPFHKLDTVNFSQHPNGLILESDLFWEVGEYYYYHVSAELPYVILLAYDAKYSDEIARGYLWYRLTQVGIAGIFFVLFLWMTRVRMVKPLLEMTTIMSDVARGQSFNSLPKSGPIEIELLAAQIHRVSDYIAENKRIENELRHKIIQFIKAKETTEIQKRSQLEFLAYICQDIRTFLNSIIGSAQVVKDQLHGPLENRKYRQYVTDIFNTGNVLMQYTQDIATMAKADTGYFTLSEDIVNIPETISKAVRFVSDRLQASQLGVKIQLQEPTPKLIADTTLIQQMLSNVLLLTIDHTPPGGVITLEALFVSESRDKGVFAFIISSHPPQPRESNVLLELAYELLHSATTSTPPSHGISGDGHPNIGLELARTIVRLHGGAMDIATSTDNALTITILVPSHRVRFIDNEE